MKRDYIKELQPDNIPLEKQNLILGEYLMDNFSEELKGGGAIETAIQIIENERLVEVERKQNA